MSEKKEIREVKLGVVVKEFVSKNTGNTIQLGFLTIQTDYSKKIEICLSPKDYYKMKPFIDKVAKFLDSAEAE